MVIALVDRTANSWPKLGETILDLRCELSVASGASFHFIWGKRLDKPDTLIIDLSDCESRAIALQIPNDHASMLASDVKSYVAKGRVEIGQRIRAVREKKGLSQTQAAQVLGCTRVTYTRIKLGQAELTVSELEYLALNWDVSLKTLLA
jgi:DNA-binding XRE family transcriptional regulator